MGFSVMEEIRLKRLVDDDGGHWFFNLVGFTIGMCAIYFVGVLFALSVPAQRQDATGQRYLCWYENPWWPWEKPDVQVCIAEHHRITRQEAK